MQCSTILYTSPRGERSSSNPLAATEAIATLKCRSIVQRNSNDRHYGHERTPRPVEMPVRDCQDDDGDSDIWPKCRLLDDPMVVRA